MDQINNYRQILCQFLREFAHDDPEAQLIFDLERDRYLVMHVGWRKDHRIYGCAIQLVQECRIKNAELRIKKL